MPLPSVRPANEQTASAVPGDGAGSSLEEEKMQAIKENLMGSSEGEVEEGEKGERGTGASTSKGS